MSDVVFGAAFGAMQIIYAAYRDVKSNRENCVALVHRAEIVVEELKLLVARHLQEEEIIARRVDALLLAFETTAQVIRRIGHKNWLKALLDADRDAIQVEHCHRCLTDLMFLFNIEQNMDQWNQQQENEYARKRDHQNLLQVAHSVQSELTTQGEIIGDVLDMVRTLSQSPTFNASGRGISQDSVANRTHHGLGSPNTRDNELSHSDSSERSSVARGEGGAQSSGKSVPRSQRRRSWMDKFGLQGIAALRSSITSVRPLHTSKTRKKSCSQAVGTTTLLTPAAPKYKSENSKKPPKGVSRDKIGGVSKSTCKRTSRQLQASPVPQAASLHSPQPRPGSRTPSPSPCAKYVEVRYYSGDMVSGVLLSKTFNSLGKTTIGELRRANSHATHASKLSRLNEGNFVMEIPDGVRPADVLDISPWTNSQCSLPVVWVLRSCGIHLEPIKISITRGSCLQWALVPCTSNTLVQDMTNAIGELVNREITACFRRDGQQVHQMDQRQLLRDCAVGRGMHLEVIL